MRVEFVKEQLTFTGDDNAMSTLLLSVMGAFAEFERALSANHQHKGIALAKQRGAYRGRSVVPPKSWRGFLCRFRLGLGFPDLVVDG